MALDAEQCNFFVCPATLKNKRDCLKLIDSISDYSKRCINISGKNMPFSIIFTLNLLSSTSQIVNRLSFKPKIEINNFMNEYIEQYFLQHYKPIQIPFLYAIIMQNKAVYLFDLSKRNDSPKQRAQSVTHWKTALEYVNMYENQLRNNQLNVLSKIVYETLKLQNSFTVLQGEILFNLAVASIGLKNNKMTIEMMNKSFQYFIVNHSQYSLYTDYDHVGFDLVNQIIERLTFWDCYQGKTHQKRYKSLLKIGVKSFKKFYDNNRQIYAESYVVFLSYLGEYYACFENKFDKSKRLLYKAMNIIRNYDEYAVILSEIYYFLIWIEISFCNVNECKFLLKMRMDYNKHFNLLRHFKMNKADLKQVRDMKNWSQTRKHEQFSTCWEGILQDLKRDATEMVTSQCVFEYVNYFKNEKYYQIMKNLCCFKECNYSKCKAKDKKMSICSTCKSVYYCCRKHQKNDWKIKHRFECQIREQRDFKFTLKLFWEPQMQGENIRFVECPLK
eukprot:440035_1